MSMRKVESDLYNDQISVSFRRSSPKDSTMQSAPSPFAFAGYWLKLCLRTKGRINACKPSLYEGYMCKKACRNFTFK